MLVSSFYEVLRDNPDLKIVCKDKYYELDEIVDGKINSISFNNNDELIIEIEEVLMWDYDFHYFTLEDLLEVLNVKFIIKDLFCTDLVYNIDLDEYNIDNIYIYNKVMYIFLDYAHEEEFEEDSSADEEYHRLKEEEGL